MKLEHGGNINAAAQRFNVPLEQWVDLSTGISPWGWPVPSVPQQVWQALPYSDGELEATAARYYGCPRDAVLAAPGSQYALQFAPALLPKGTVAIPQRGYAEHRCAWQRAGHQVVDYADGAALQALVLAETVDHALVINPNNPTGEVLPAPQLQALHQRLHSRGGWLVVDEAFADIVPGVTLAPRCPSPGLIVYRSVGKFFGLAGIRLGFLLAPVSVCAELSAMMPPWLLSHPARWIGTAALADTTWHVQQQQRLAQATKQWLETLSTTVPGLRFTDTALFITGRGNDRYCAALHLAMARRGVLLRLFETIDGQRLLRFGLPLPAVREQVVQSLREAVEECECELV